MGSIRDEHDKLINETEEAQRLQAERQETAVRTDKLIHQVFRQSPEGRDLLEIWTERNLINHDPIRHGEAHDPYDIALEVGTQNFIREIIRTCKRVDEGH